MIQLVCVKTIMQCNIFTQDEKSVHFLSLLSWVIPFGFHTMDFVGHYSQTHTTHFESNNYFHQLHFFHSLHVSVNSFSNISSLSLHQLSLFRYINYSIHLLQAPCLLPSFVPIVIVAAPHNSVQLLTVECIWTILVHTYS